MSVEVHLQHTTKRFGDVVALNDVSLDIARGELFFLLGPSGCGKTTCLRTIAGFYQPDSGQLLFDDRLMNGVPPHRRNTGMVFQNYALWPHMTVYQNVEYGLNVRRIDANEKKMRVMEALEIVQMRAYADRTSNQLSGGQQQRVALARALVIQPDVLLLDEPLSNLDAKLRLEMRREIKRIHSEAGITSVYVTHDQTEALSLADRMAVMNDGEIAQIGAPREVYNMPSNRFVAGFIGETNFIDGKFVGGNGREGVVETPIGRIYSSVISDKHDPEVAVSCSIRPEAIHINDTPIQDAPNQFAAKITSLTYLGNIEEYMLQLDQGIELKAVLHNPGQEAREPGRDVVIDVRPRDVVVLPADQPTTSFNAS